MSRSHLALLLMPFAAAMAQSATPVTTDTSSTSIAPPRAISPATAALLNAALPKIAPAKPAATKAAAELPDLRDPEKPHNNVVRLPNYVVREPRPPIFTERELYGEAAFGQRLARRYYPEWYLAFNRVAIFTPLALYFAPAADSARARFDDEERLRRFGEFADLTNMVMWSNSTAGARVKDAVQKTFLRRNDYGWRGDNPR